MPPTDLFEPIEDKEMAEAEVGSLFFFFTFLLDPSRLRDPDAVAVFFSLGGVSEPGRQKNCFSFFGQLNKPELMRLYQT